MIKKRPYVGVVFQINEYKYFAPLTSAKESRNKLNNQTTIKIIDKNEEFLGAIRFNNMIPCQDEHINIIKISEIENSNYRNLLNKQYEIIKYNLKDKIDIKATKVYNKKINNPNDFVSGLCCEFTELEKLLK